MVRDTSYFVMPGNKVDTEMAESLWTSPFLWDCMWARSKHPVSSHSFHIHHRVPALLLLVITFFCLYYFYWSMRWVLEILAIFYTERFTSTLIIYMFLLLTFPGFNTLSFGLIISFCYPLFLPSPYQGPRAGTRSLQTIFPRLRMHILACHDKAPQSLFFFFLKQVSVCAA